MAPPTWSEKNNFGDYAASIKPIQRFIRFHLKTIALTILCLVGVLTFLAYQSSPSAFSSSSSKSSSSSSHHQSKNNHPSSHHQSSISSRPKTRSSWKGWDNINYLFTFGDSWTSNNFAHDGIQPSPANPIGNPAFPGDASCNGPNWVARLTATYNTSFIKAYDLAHGAATIDRTIIPPLFTQSFTFREQVDQIFVPTYGDAPHYAPWKASDALVAVWSGIVDAELFTRNGNETSLVPDLVASYFTGIDRLYQSGLRNFLLLKLPPMYRTPDVEDRILSQSFLKAFHHEMDKQTRNITEIYEDVEIMLFDTYRAFNAFLDRPREFEAMDRVQNFTDWCQDYNDMLGVIVDSIDAYKPECGVSIDAYFWINAIHPGFAVHNATTAAISQHCFQEPRGEWCS